MTTVEEKTAFLEVADIETASDDYARRFEGEVGKWFLQVQEQAILDMLSPYPHARILDVGGGHGQLTGALIDNGFKLTVLDSDEICRRRIDTYIQQGLCDFKVGDILHLPYPDNSFDVVISLRLLPHVTRWKAFLKELGRVAAQAIILDYPEVRSINAIAPYTFSMKKSLEGNTRTFTTFRDYQIISILEPHGFRKSSRFPEFFLPMVLHRKMKAVRVSSGLEALFRKIGFTAALGSPVILKLEKTPQGGLEGETSK